MSSGQLVRPGSATIHRILVVDNDKSDAERLQEDLDAFGFQVDHARDGGQAQSIFVMRQPDLVLLELLLPGESGFEVCERLKQTNDSIPVIILTAIELEDARRLAERVGADAYLLKPWARATLVKTIDEVAEKAWEKSRDNGKSVDRVRFSCRNCGKKFSVSSSHRGKILTCPKCGEPVHVPRYD